MSPWAVVWHCLHDPRFSCFDAIQECDRPTNRHSQIDRHRISAYTVLAYHASIALCGKKKLSIYRRGIKKIR